MLPLYALVRPLRKFISVNMRAREITQDHFKVMHPFSMWSAEQSITEHILCALLLYQFPMHVHRFQSNELSKARN